MLGKHNENIEINGAHIHNLKNINVRIPKDELVVLVAYRVGSRWRDRSLLLEQFVVPSVVE